MWETYERNRCQSTNYAIFHLIMVMIMHFALAGFVLFSHPAAVQNPGACDECVRCAGLHQPAVSTWRQTAQTCESTTMATTNTTTTAANKFWWCSDVNQLWFKPLWETAMVKCLMISCCLITVLQSLVRPNSLCCGFYLVLISLF